MLKLKSYIPILLVATLVLTSCTKSDSPQITDTSTSNPGSKSYAPETLIAIADTGDCREPAEKVAQAISEAEGTIIIAGDLAYPNGSTEDFQNCFDPLFKSELDRLHAVPGDNEYKTGSADAFWDSLGDSAGNKGEGWLSFDLGAWQIIGLNSECPKVGGCDAESDQYKWLQAELDKSDKECKLAFWHMPRFTSSPNYKGFPRLAAMYDLLDQAGTDVLIVGNSHHYERFTQLDSQGNPDADGIRNFTAGIGGAPLGQGFSEPLPGSEVRNTETMGYLQFELSQDEYKWEFVKVGTKGDLVDSGSDKCS